MKKFIAVILILMMTPFAALAQEIYKDTTTTQITKGVTLTTVRKFYGSYSLNINSIEADLTNKDLSLELLKNEKGIDKTDTVLNLAKKEEGTVAAINGDFFSNYKNGQSFSLGIEIKDGKLLQSHIQENMAAGFVQDGKLDFSYIKFSSNVKMANEAVLPISHINKPTDYYGALLMYTADFNGGVSPFFPYGITVVTIENDVVTGKGVSLGGTVPIPQNGYILAIDDIMTPILDINTSVGDKIELTVAAEPSIEKVNAAFGGGTLLLKDGQKTPITHTVNGNAPRTAIGTNGDGSKIYMITVDGRQDISRGVSLEVLQDICLELGCVNAMNFDGGGSTNMVGKTLENAQLHTLNSPSENRKVINAVGISSSAVPQKVSGFKITAQSDVILSGDSTKIKVIPYDANFNTPLPLTDEIKWEADGKIENDAYYPQSGGNHTIKLLYGGEQKAQYEFKVIDKVAGIIAPSGYRLKIGESISQEKLAKVFDENGNTAQVTNLMLLNPKFDESMLSLENGKIAAFKEGASEMVLEKDGAQKTITFICGDLSADKKDAVTIDSKNTEKSDGTTFNIIGGMPLNTLMERLCYLRAASVLKEADISAVIGGKIENSLTPEGLSPLMADKYNEAHYKDAIVISIKQKDKSLNVDSQWAKIVNSVKQSPQKNVFILLQNAPEFKNPLEEEAFEHILKSGKNVFVIYNGEENSVVIKDKNLRYISLSDGSDYSSIPSKMKNIKYLSFNITENDVTYTFKKLY